MNENTSTDALRNQSAIGIFDSGLGGLSVLQHIHQQLPNETLLYFADSAYAPYGNKGNTWIAERSLQICEYLLTQNIKALVVACNTATTSAVHEIRKHHPELIVVGVEPGLKPASLISQSKVIGVLATEATLKSPRFNQLAAHLTEENGVRFLLQACHGLVEYIERGELNSPELALLIKQYVEPLIAQKADVLVLGCTHYPFLQEQISQQAGHNVRLIDTGIAIAQRLLDLLSKQNLLNSTDHKASMSLLSTGSIHPLKSFCTRLTALDETQLDIKNVQLPLNAQSKAIIANAK